MLRTLLILTAMLAATPPRPVTYNWREAGEYPFYDGTKTVMEYREADLRIAQPGTGKALSDGDIRTPKQWLQLVAKNWLRTDSTHVIDGNLYRDGTVNYTDFAVISREWRPAEREIIVYPQPIFIDPNEPLVKAEPAAEPIITFRIAATTTEGGVYHLPSCRYVTDTAKTITIEQAELYRPCRVCKPDELDSLLAEFLPKTGVPNGQ